MAYCTCKSDDIDDDAEDISNLMLELESIGINICFGVYAHKIPVWSITVSGIQVRDGKISFPYDVVICKHDSCNTRQEDRITIIRLRGTDRIPGQI